MISLNIVSLISGAMYIGDLEERMEAILEEISAAEGQIILFIDEIHTIQVDPCEDLSDDDIRTAIQNATGPRNALFVPEVPFEVLVRRQIARLLDPSLQCLRFVYDELIMMSRACEATETLRFPMLRKRMDEVMGKFLHEGLKPAERRIVNIVEMEVI
ncbi:hypothetical protein F0562_012354 [Nyssa sinensis]|uniref:Dynamin stalk domain-containing protein n=1 Tax=Nyssa sinensis TaxID=561372 RepID=A0A5J4ZV28_9ASTE|nr:hypothetical protein F0562_012354 [Nyssa sinensis]